MAKRLHPERRDPLLQFTVPEALAVIERASGNLRGFLVSSFPLGDRITVAQLMWLYRWRGALALAEKGYDLWRVVRLLNPVAAATQELRERFTRQLYEMGREHLARRLARAFVKEVGRAAIDFYGGNLRVTPSSCAPRTDRIARDMTLPRHAEAEPIRILVAGQTGAGKSSLVNALANAVEAAVDALPATARFTAYRLTHEGLPAALVVDSPGLTGADAPGRPDRSRRRLRHDVWVCSAARAAREIDASRWPPSAPTSPASPTGAARRCCWCSPTSTHLRPFDEWDPPYDLTQATSIKAESILGAMQAAGAELGFAADEIVPVRADIAVAPYNVDAVWAKIMALMPEAQRARLLRTLGDIKSASAWGTVWSQAVNAGRVVRGTFLSRGSTP